MPQQPQAKMHTETGAHGGEQHKFPPFDTTTFPSQLLWLTITFALLYVGVSKLVLPRIGVIFEQRRGRIAGDLDSAQKLKAQTEEAIASYEKALATAREHAHAIAQDMREKIKADIDAERVKVEASLNAKVAEAEQQIAAQRTKVMGEVEGIASTVAKAIVEHLTASANGDSSLKKTA